MAELLQEASILYLLELSRQPVGGDPVRGATPEQEKAQPAADAIEEKEIQALLRTWAAKARHLLHPLRIGEGAMP